MTPEHFHELGQAVRGAVAHYVRRRAPAPLDDMEQEAWRIAIAAYRKFDPAFGSRLYSYAYAAVKRSLWIQVAHWSAVPTLKKRVDLSEQFSSRTSVLPHHAVTEVSPEGEILEREAEIRQRWRLRRAGRLIRDLLRKLPDRDAEIVTRKYGLDGRTPERRKEIGRRLGVDSKAVSAALSRYAAMVRTDRKLLETHREMEEER